MLASLGIATEKVGDLLQPFVTVPSAVSNPPTFIFEAPQKHNYDLRKPPGNDWTPSPEQLRAEDVIEYHIVDANGTVHEHTATVTRTLHISACRQDVDIGSDTFPAGTTYVKVRFTRGALVSPWSPVVEFTMPSAPGTAFAPKMITNATNDSAAFGPIFNNWWRDQKQSARVRVNGESTDSHYAGADTTGAEAAFNANQEIGEMNGLDYTWAYFSLTPSSSFGFIGIDFASHVQGGDEMVMTWEEETEGSITGVRDTITQITNVVEDLENGRATFDLEVANDFTSGNWNIGFTFDNTKSGGVDNWRLFRAQDEDAIDAGLEWTEEYIYFHGQFNTVRFNVTIQDANNSDNVTDYAHLATVDDRIWMQGGLTFDRKPGVPLSVIVEFAERTGVRPWICLNHLLTDAAVVSYATYMRDNYSGEVVYELSNEVWNGTFLQQGDYEDLGEAKWPGEYTPNSDSNRYYGWRSAGMMDLVRGVYGEDSGSGRWIGVLEHQTTSDVANAGRNYAGAQEYLDDDLGDGTVMSDLFSWHAITTYWMGVYANTVSDTKAQQILPYLKQGQWSVNNYLDLILRDNTTTTVDGVSWGSNLKGQIDKYAAHKTLADSHGLELVPYEGGFHGVCGTSLKDGNGINEPYADLFNHGQTRYVYSLKGCQMEKDNLDAFLEKSDYPMQFVMVNQASRHGAWGPAPMLGIHTDRDNLIWAYNLGVEWRSGYRPIRMDFVAS